MSGTDETPQSTSLGAAIRQHSLRLGAFALGAALLLALIFNGTKARIAQQRLAAERVALDAVMPAALHDNDLLADSFMIDPAASAYAELELLGLSSTRPAYRATLQGRTSGVILPLETPEGYSGTITLLIGITADGSISGTRVLQHGETPGLGDKIDLRASDWILGFDRRSLANTDEVLWQVKKDGGDFDQFVGATITPRAVVGAVHNALLFFDKNKELLLN